MEQLYTVTSMPNKAAGLAKADTQLKQIRFYLRLAHDLRLLPTRKYEHGCKQIEEIGRLLGGWINSVRN